VPPTSNILLSTIKPEPDALRCRELIKPGDRVVDVGANIGAYTRLMSESIGPEGLVHSYEPIPETFSYLHNNVKKCGVDNVIVHNAAVSTQAGEFKMRIPRHNFYRPRCRRNATFRSKRLPLMKNFLRRPVCPSFKCDAEGHERKVIEGALKLIQRDHPVWLIETWNEDVIRRMQELGYKATKLTNDWLFSPNVA
jgi:FkbM family methyltransferase